MSTSLGTSRSPSPSSRPFEPAWRAAAARALIVSGTLMLAAALLGPGLVDTLGSLADDFGRRRGQVQALAPLVAQARYRAATYETARESDYVLWCVDRTGEAEGYLSGRPMHPILFSSAPGRLEFPRNSPQQGGRCTTIVAQVEGRRPQGLLLRFIGIP